MAGFTARYDIGEMADDSSIVQPGVRNGESKPREQWIDVAKGIAIILMVQGHILGGLMAAGILDIHGPAPNVYSWIYSFHMPAFMFLSGLFLSRSADKGILPFASARLSMLYYPSLLWGFLNFVATFVFRHYINSEPNASGLLLLLYHPLSGFWFLTTLLELSLAFAVLRTARVPAWLMLCVCAVGALWASAGYHPIVYQFCWYGFWLLLAVVTAKFVLTQARILPVYAFVLIGISGCVWVSLTFEPEGMGPILQQAPCAFAGILMLISVSVIVTRLRILHVLEQMLSFCGRYSLEIYLVHSLAWVAARTLLVSVLHVRYPGMVVPFTLIVGVTAPIAFARAAESARIGWLFRFGPATQRKAIERKA